jgi:hypothetical protein
MARHRKSTRTQRAFDLELPPYRAECVFLINYTPAAYAKYVKQRFGVTDAQSPDLCAFFTTFAHDSGYSIHLVCVNSYDGSNNAIATLAHEITHLTQAVLARVNVTDNEAFAYLFDSTLERCLDRLTPRPA